jgi:hypothetical protein
VGVILGEFGEDLKSVALAAQASSSRVLGGNNDDEPDVSGSCSVVFASDGVLRLADETRKRQELV